MLVNVEIGDGRAGDVTCGSELAEDRTDGRRVQTWMAFICLHPARHEHEGCVGGEMWRAKPTRAVATVSATQATAS